MKEPSTRSRLALFVAFGANQLTTLTIPASASIHGQNNAFFHTDLWLFNGSPTIPATATARHRCAAGQTCGSSNITFNIPPRSSISRTDVLGSSFGDAGTSGAIELTFDGALTKVTVLSRTYSPSLPLPTTGPAIPRFRREKRARDRS